MRLLVNEILKSESVHHRDELHPINLDSGLDALEKYNALTCLWIQAEWIDATTGEYLMTGIYIFTPSELLCFVDDLSPLAKGTLKDIIIPEIKNGYDFDLTSVIDSPVSERHIVGCSERPQRMIPGVRLGYKLSTMGGKSKGNHWYSIRDDYPEYVSAHIAITDAIVVTSS